MGGMQHEKEIYRRMGKWIAWQRQLRFDATKSKAFSRQGFYATTPYHPLYELRVGMSVCSRATIQRLEKGMSISDSNILRFCLGKLGHPHQLMDDRILRIDRQLIQLVSQTQWHHKSSRDRLKRQILRLRRMEGSFLFDLDARALLMYGAWIEDRKGLSETSFKLLCASFEILNPSVQTCLGWMLVFETYRSPLLWKHHLCVSRVLNTSMFDSDWLEWFNQVFAVRRVDWPSPLDSLVLPLSIRQFMMACSLYSFDTLQSYQSFRRKIRTVYSTHRLLRFEPYPHMQGQLLIQHHALGFSLSKTS